MKGWKPTVDVGDGEESLMRTMSAVCGHVGGLAVCVCVGKTSGGDAEINRYGF